MDWTYRGKKITRLPPEVVGFVYIIYYTNGQKYIGKKLARSTKMIPATVSGKQRPGSERIKKLIHRDEHGKILVSRKDKRAAKERGQKAKMESYDVVTTEHKWKQYEGSSEENKGLTIKTKVITHLCTNKLSMSYLETKELFSVNAPMNEEYTNKVIGKTYWDNALDGLYTGPIPEHCLFEGDYS